jgi:hypothetical protein
MVDKILKYANDNIQLSVAEKEIDLFQVNIRIIIALKSFLINEKYLY